MPKKEFLEFCEDFIKKHHFTPSGFGRKALGLSYFIYRLRKGCEAREETQNKVFAFIEKYESEER